MAEIWHPKPIPLWLATVICLLSPRFAGANCSAAFCSLSTDWAGQGVWTEPGFRLDIRYEQVVQDTLREGTGEVSLDEEEAEQEGLHQLERKTVNRNLIVTLDYAIDANWGISVSLPVVNREHTHIALPEHHEEGALAAPGFGAHEGEEGGEKERWDFTELGDLRVVARYSFAVEGDFLAQPRVWGAEFGLKLPTGRFHVENDEGEQAERTLQPGTGTTDLILGGFVTQRLSGTSSTLFAKLLGQEALRERDDFAPGTRITLDGGYRYQATDPFGLMVQLNLLWKGKDRGEEAEPEDSGGTFLFLSPGLAYAVTLDVQLYGFYQVPLYQDVNGMQLTADDSIVLGVGIRF